MLPAGASQFTFVNLEAAMERPAFRDVVELQLSHFVNLDEIPLAEELLRSTHVSAIVMGDFYTRFEWACILTRIHRWTGMDGVRTAEGVRELQAR